MREQLIQYVSLLFAGTQNCGDIKQEILQNTLDRYDDLIAEGKAPEAAYRLAITGIGDINEILRGTVQPENTGHSPASAPEESHDTPLKKLFRAVAIALYILCPVPLFVLSEFGMGTLGLCGLLAVVAVATCLMILGAKKEAKKEEAYETFRKTPENELQKSISGMIWAIGLALYFIISFITGAWYITWVLFPIIGATQGLVRAILDLKEANKNEI